MKKMSYIGHIFLPAFLIVIFNNGPALAAGPIEFNTHFIRAARKVKNSVVNIEIYRSRKKPGQDQYTKIAYASGTVISGGYIVTNYHVVMKGNYYRVTSARGQKIKLERFSSNRPFLADPGTDLALLKINEISRQVVTPITFDDSGELQVGEWVLAVGNPFGLRQSITSGIVSSKGRDNIGFADIENFIQTDVPINPGNSGGPLVNLKGRLVGINTAIRSISGGYQGISFAIPSNIVERVCSDLLRYGRVRRGWLGFLVREKHYSREGGELFLEIISVIKGSPAEMIGLKTGDIIREVDGIKITSMGRLIKIVGNKRIGTKLYLSISRNGKLSNFQLILREKREYRTIRRALNALFARYGFDVDENSDSGEVIVSSIAPQGIGYNIRQGDVVVSVNGRRIASLDSFVKNFERQDRTISRMTVLRDSQTIIIRMER